ncbi:tRNA wybutosine-synthesizing protein 4 [Fistulifera solaris]|jgi:O-methyltransferase involved in polyketide biosynthesis|uniref:Leucine carboxyl methyltransferase 1 n=1 Tax=Fistulifera solaris TaxID=1519565 RepID=A0A1Z5KRM3_FISSO|nr:tRNA wybutosine-synthesizing protein 4 [Fistulifera solaris]|eukprot:GAX28641.1 tRNA wybutosine-synthesizing protein 4 [Fistulifera solaris]
MATAGDAVTTKFATVQAGYYEDPFIAAFHNASSILARRRNNQSRPIQVIIKRGTFARVCCIEKTIEKFLGLIEPSQIAQVVVLGAGKDTNYFRLIQSRLGSNSPFVRWVEVDHATILQEKLSVIDDNSALFNVEKLGNGDYIELKPIDPSAQDRSNCVMIAHDLKSGTDLLMQKLVRSGLHPEAPTLFISECVFMYMPDNETRRLLSALSATFQKSCICQYEPIVGNGDSFGQMMEENLSKAGVAGADSGLLKVRSNHDHANRLYETGFTIAIACDMYAAYEAILTDEQRLRANRSEFLDELEEFVLIMKHYSFSLGSTSESSIGRRLCTLGKDSHLGFEANRSISRLS